MTLLHGMLSRRTDVETENNITDISEILVHFNYVFLAF